MKRETFRDIPHIYTSNARVLEQTKEYGTYILQITLLANLPQLITIILQHEAARRLSDVAWRPKPISRGTRQLPGAARSGPHTGARRLGERHGCTTVGGGFSSPQKPKFFVTSNLAVHT